jgi:hypothetical protein
LERPRVVVLVEDSARTEAARVVNGLRGRFAVQVVYQPSVFERELRHEACCGVVVTRSLAQPLLPKAKVVRSLPRVILVARRDRSSEAHLQNQGHPSQSFLWIEPEKTDRLTNPYCLAAFIDHALGKARRALENSALLPPRTLLCEAISRILAVHPVKPLKSVKGSALVISRSERWLEDRWKELQRDAVRVRIPALKDLLKAVLFLRFLSLWLTGSTPTDCARLLGVSTHTLHRYCLEFTKRDLREIEPSELWRDVFPLVHDTLAWLHEGGTLPPV